MDDTFKTTPKDKETITALWHLQKIILDTLDFNQVVQRIVDGLLVELGYLKLGYRIIVLTLIDEDRQVLKRISLSQTEEAAKAQQASAVPFHDIEIPLSAQNNLLIKALNQKKPFVTNFWPDIFTPVLTVEQALTNQKASNIKTSMIYPVVVKDKAIGALIFSMVKSEEEVSEIERDLINGFTDIVGLAVQNSRLYSSVEQTTKQLGELNKRLRELDLLKSEFVSVASHELRTPMTSIKSYLWMALAGRGGPISDKQKYYLERAYTSTDRLIKLVNDLLNVSRIESGRMSLDIQKVSIESLIDEMISEIRPRADELGVKVTNLCDKNHPLPEVLADPDKIKEVLINLIGNSLKFTPSGGQVNITCDTSDHMVATHVSDNGEGIDPDNLPKLFQKFGLVVGSYTTNLKASQGTGLGLYISKSLVELHHGQISVASAGHGQGATFTFTLPIYSEEEAEKIRREHEGKEELGIIHSTID